MLYYFYDNIKKHFKYISYADGYPLLLSEILYSNNKYKVKYLVGKSPAK